MPFILEKMANNATILGPFIYHDETPAGRPLIDGVKTTKPLHAFFNSFPLLEVFFSSAPIQPEEKN